MGFVKSVAGDILREVLCHEAPSKNSVFDNGIWTAARPTDTSLAERRNDNCNEHARILHNHTNLRNFQHKEVIRRTN